MSTKEENTIPSTFEFPSSTREETLTAENPAPLPSQEEMPNENELIPLSQSRTFFSAESAESVAAHSKIESNPYFSK